MQENGARQVVQCSCGAMTLWRGLPRFLEKGWHTDLRTGGGICPECFRPGKVVLPVPRWFKAKNFPLPPCPPMTKEKAKRRASK